MTNIGYKKIFVAVCIIILAASPVFETNGSAKTTKNRETDFTHTVLGELGTATWCPHCPPTSAALYEIYSSSNYDFVYVSLVADKNPKAGLRCGELGLTGYPTTFFDGGYNHVLGGYGDTTPYVNAINECGSRTDVYNITIEPKVKWKGEEQLLINISITYHGNPVYTGKIRAYVTEIVSRWSDSSGKPYHFGMLDYAFNEDITLSNGETLNLTTLWDGNKEGFDIDPENIMIIAAVYDSHTDYVDNTAVATIYSGLPDTTITSGPQGIINETSVTFTWTGNDEETPVEDLQYSYKLEPRDTNWSQWSHNTSVTYTELTEGEYRFMVKTKNEKGEEDPIPATRLFAVNQGIPPTVKLTKPGREIYINNKKIMPFIVPFVIGNIDIEADATDENGIQRVDFYVDDVLRYSDYYAPYRCSTWQSTSFFLGKHIIKVVAYDNIGNHASDEIKVWKLF